MGRGQQAVDGSLVRVRGLVREKGLGLGFGRRQAGEVEREPTQQGVARGFGRGLESFGGELPTDEVVDGVAGNGGLLGRFEGPVASPDGAFGDPASEDVDLRSMSALTSGLPGTNASLAKASSRRSRRSLAFRCDSS
jgi:hypothetical protein